MNTITLFLDLSYTIDGVTVTGEEIKDALIDSAFLKSRLSDLIGGDSE